MERYIYVFSQLYGIKAASLRLFSVYGPRQCKQIVFDFINKISNNARLEILGDGTQVRDLVYVDDVIQALLLIAQQGPLQGEVYNVATGKGCTTLELAEIVYQAMGLEPNYYFTGTVRPGDPNVWVADITRIRKLGFDPTFSLEVGIKKTLDWYQANQKPNKTELP
jgi:nucleoside-diphosphate-sugar epimerase